jgi:hypothetical protein
MRAQKPLYFQFSVAVTILACLASRGLAVAPDWITQYGTTLGESNYTLTTDKTGNIFTAGNELLCKLDSSGNVEWVDRLESDYPLSLLDSVTDAQGSLFVTGFVSAAIAGLPDAVLRRYDAEGELVWSKQIGSPRHDTGRGIVVDQSGNVIFSGTTLGSLAGVNPRDNREDVFIYKYGPDGTELSALQFGTTEGDSFSGISIDRNDNLYIAGTTGGSLAATNAGRSDGFVRKFAPDGSTLWTQQFGTPFYDRGSDIAADLDGNVFVAGRTEGVFGSPNLGSDTETFLSKLDSAGAIQWTKQFGADDDIAPSSIATDKAGSVFVLGSTRGLIDGSNAGGSDIFLRKFNTSGSQLWSTRLGSAGDDFAAELWTDGMGSILVSGTTTGLLGASQLGQGDLFVAKFTDPQWDIGDFDGNSIVDGNDFLIWQRTGAPLSDLENWRANYGQQPENGALGVPEPSTAILFPLGAFALRRLRRRVA